MDAIAAIYDAVDDDDAYQALPAAIAAHVDARSCVIFGFDAARRPTSLVSAYFPPDMIALQLTHEIAALDVWTPIGVRPGFIGRVHNAEDFWDVPAFRQTAFFNEAIRPFDDDTARCLGGVAPIDGGYMSMAVHLGSGRRGFEAKDKAALGELFPHARRVLELRARLAAAEGRTALSIGALDARHDAVFVVNATGRPLLMNASAQAMVASQDGLILSRIGLRARHDAANRLFVDAITAACGRRGAQGGALSLPRPSLSPLRALVSPVQAGHRTHALVVVNDPARTDPQQVANLRGFYGLSMAEAETAVVLARGSTPQEAADLRGVSLPTIRTQIRHLLRKTEARGIPELVALVTSAPGRAAPA
jgi:DNA-binding CsgD family transcriptional regulator/PAS domain-containing protein